jgi:polyisoprenoid-binding protein YceI
MLTSKAQADDSPAAEPAAPQLPGWTFDPDRSEAGFSADLMGAMWLNGRFKGVHGKLYLDPEDPGTSSCFGEIDATTLYAGEPLINTQVRTADFLDVEEHPKITFAGRSSRRTGESDFKAEVRLTLRGTAHLVIMDVAYVEPWSAPVRRNGEHLGTATRVGLKADGLITRRDLGVLDGLPDRRTPIAEAIEITLQLEAILDTDLERIRATELRGGGEAP